MRFDPLIEQLLSWFSDEPKPEKIYHVTHSELAAMMRKLALRVSAATAVYLQYQPEYLEIWLEKDISKEKENGEE